MILRAMIIACPACSTRYTVPDRAIGADGRVVRCAKCRHSWFQQGPEPDESTADMPAEPTVPAPAPMAPWPDASSLGANDMPAANDPPPAITVPGADADQPRARDFARTPSSFAHEPPFRPRRRGRWWLIAAIVLLLIAAAAIGAVAEFGLPDGLSTPHRGLAGSAPDLVLDFPANRQQRRPLPNGSDFFHVSGSIRNAGTARRAVPTLMIVLRDDQKAIVYSLETASPKPVLAPGEREAIDQAIIDAPRSARSAEIGWKPN